MIRRVPDRAHPIPPFSRAEAFCQQFDTQRECEATHRRYSQRFQRRRGRARGGGRPRRAASTASVPLKAARYRCNWDEVNREPPYACRADKWGREASRDLPRPCRGIKSEAKCLQVGRRADGEGEQQCLWTFTPNIPPRGRSICRARPGSRERYRRPRAVAPDAEEEGEPER